MERLEYQKYLKGPRWQRIRRRLWLDGYHCRGCHATTGLQVHHASYVWRGKLWFLGEWFEFLDTITLCDKCHGAIHRAQPIKEFAD